MRKNIALPLIVSVASLLAFSACSSNPPRSAEPTQSAITSQQAQTEFKSIAEASCKAALEQGSVERSISDAGFILVMVPKNDAYKDFSAAYFQPDDTYELIWEIDAFAACGASITFDLAEEAGQETDLEVSFNPATGSYETFQDLGEFGPLRISYEIDGGKISTVSILSSPDVEKRTVSYGGLAESELMILKTAADRFLAQSD